MALRVASRCALLTSDSKPRIPATGAVSLSAAATPLAHARLFLTTAGSDSRLAEITASHQFRPSRVGGLRRSLTGPATTSVDRELVRPFGGRRASSKRLGHPPRLRRNKPPDPGACTRHRRIRLHRRALHPPTPRPGLPRPHDRAVLDAGERRACGAHRRRHGERRRTDLRGGRPHSRRRVGDACAAATSCCTSPRPFTLGMSRTRTM